MSRLKNKTGIAEYMVWGIVLEKGSRQTHRHVRERNRIMHRRGIIAQNCKCEGSRVLKSQISSLYSCIVLRQILCR